MRGLSNAFKNSVIRDWLSNVTLQGSAKLFNSVYDTHLSIAMLRNSALLRKSQLSKATVVTQLSIALRLSIATHLNILSISAFLSISAILIELSNNLYLLDS